MDISPIPLSGPEDARGSIDMDCDHPNRRENLERLAPEERSIVMSFGVPKPAIVNFPHCIFRNGPSTFRRVLECVRCKVGVWGARPMYDWDGTSYLEPDDGLAAVDFRLFGLPLNQDEVLRRQAYGTASFSMVMDVSTHSATIAQLWGAAGAENDLAYDSCIRTVTDWVEHVGWLYVPLQYEHVNALFVTSLRGERLVQAVKAALQADGEPVLRVTRSTEGPYRLLGM